MLPLQINKKNVIIERKINKGSFADIYSALDFSSSQSLVLKIEKKNASNSTIDTETAILKSLHNIQGIPHILWSGKINQRSAFITDRLGSSLHDYLSDLKRFSLETVVKMSVQLLLILEKLHEKGFIHRDIKPSNILTGNGLNRKNIYLIDFNLSKRFLDQNGEHIPLDEVEEFNGNLQFSSVNSHEFLENSRKDDLESLGYVLCFLFLGKMGWDKASSNDVIHRIAFIGKYKRHFLKNVASDSFLPTCLKHYFENVMNIGFYDKPNYENLRQIFVKFAENEGINMESEWEWDLKTELPQKNRVKYQRSSENSSNLTEISMGTGSLTTNNSKELKKPINEKKNTEENFGKFFLNYLIKILILVFLILDDNIMDEHKNENNLQEKIRKLNDLYAKIS